MVYEDYLFIVFIDCVLDEVEFDGLILCVKFLKYVYCGVMVFIY